jgi:hypothetical protein
LVLELVVVVVVPIPVYVPPEALLLELLLLPAPPPFVGHPAASIPIAEKIRIFGRSNTASMLTASSILYLRKTP